MELTGEGKWETVVRMWEEVGELPTCEGELRSSEGCLWVSPWDGY